MESPKILAQIFEIIGGQESKEPTATIYYPYEINKIKHKHNDGSLSRKDTHQSLYSFGIPYPKVNFIQGLIWNYIDCLLFDYSDDHYRDFCWERQGAKFIIDYDEVDEKIICFKNMRNLSQEKFFKLKYFISLSH